MPSTIKYVESMVTARCEGAASMNGLGELSVSKKSVKTWKEFVTDYCRSHVAGDNPGNADKFLKGHSSLKDARKLFIRLANIGHGKSRP